MIGVEVSSVKDTASNYRLFLKRLRHEVSRPDGMGSPQQRLGFADTGSRGLTVEEMTELLKGSRGEYMYHFTLQPDEVLCEFTDEDAAFDSPLTPYGLIEVVRDGFSSASLSKVRMLNRRRAAYLRFVYVGVVHPSHGIFPHMHVFAAGPELEREDFAAVERGVNEAWERAKLWWDGLTRPDELLFGGM